MILIGSIHEKHCSRCRSRDFERVKRPGIIRLLSGSSLKRYRCTKCWKSFYLIPTKGSAKLSAK